ncbi:unnamed protein product, partial [marine sediment metagenome]
VMLGSFSYAMIISFVAWIERSEIREVMEVDYG